MRQRELTDEQIEIALSTLRKVADSRSLTQGGLAQLSSVGQPTISRILSGSLRPGGELLRKLFQAVGMKLSDILDEGAGPGTELIGYLATPLTGVVDDSKAEKELGNVVNEIRAVARDAEFVNPPFDIYWPGEHNHPRKNKGIAPRQVYLTDRTRASTHDFLILFCGSPSYGMGQENEIATQAGVPAIRLLPEKISRMMTGSFINSIDVPFAGSMSNKVRIDLTKLKEALGEIRRIHYRIRSRYDSLNGNEFGARLHQLFKQNYWGKETDFASDLGVNVSYVHALMNEPMLVSNPSVRLLKRMSVLLRTSVAYLVGESNEADPTWIQSNASWRSWVVKAQGLDMAAAFAIRDDWRDQYTRDRNLQSTSSYRKDPLRESDWQKRYTEQIKKEKSGNGRLPF